MEPREQPSDERTQKAPRELQPESSQPSGTDPAVLAKLSARLLSFARDSRLNSRGGQKLLSDIEKLPVHEERVAVVNATATFGMQGRGVLALHRERMSEALLHRLINLGLDLANTFPVPVAERGSRSRIIEGGNIYHIAALEGDISLLQMLPPKLDLLNAQTASGETPLLLAYKYGTEPKSLREITKQFVEWGADITVRDDTGRQLFHYAQQYPGAGLLESLVGYWDQLGSVPINRYEAQTGLALALLDTRSIMRRVVDRLETLVAKAPRARAGVKAPVSGLLKCLDELVPSRSEILAQDARTRRGAGSKQTDLFVKAIERLDAARHILGEDVIQFLTESPLPSSDTPLLATLYQADAPPEILRAVVDLGASLSLRFDSGGRGTVEVRGGTLLHHAFNDGKQEIVDMVLESCPDVVAVADADGNTPIMTHLRACWAWGMNEVPNADFIEVCLAEGCPADAVNSSGKRAMDYAIEVGCLRTIWLLTRYNAAPPARDANRTFEVKTRKGVEEVVDFRGLIRCAMKWRSKVGHFSNKDVVTSLIDDARRILQESKSVYVTYLFLVAAADVLVSDPKARLRPNRGISLLKLSGNLLFHLPPHILSGMWGAIEWMSDNNSNIRQSRRHFNEAEMMLLLNHPREKGFEPEVLNPLTRALTATTRVFYAGIHTVRQPVVWNFARIGLYTHGFHLLFKHETEARSEYDPERGWHRTGLSLIEERLGVIKVQPRSHTDRLCGPGYLWLASSREEPIRARLLRRDAKGEEMQYQWYSLDSQTVIEFRRGYLLVTNPKFGTLVIRNSSKEFGRNILSNVAYWTRVAYRRGYRYDDLIHITPDQIESKMRPVLAPKVIEDTGAVELIYQLLRQLDVIRDYNRRQKFETVRTDAFVRDPDTNRIELAQFGGYRAPGFRQIVDFLGNRFRSVELERSTTGSISRIVPALAFAQPWYPGWVTHRFEAEPGVMRSQLSINAEVLEVLEAFRDNYFTRRIMDLDNRYGVSRFFQEAGFQTEGELILVTPRSPQDNVRRIDA